ncbi:MAG: DUF3040 domain-containing protein [Microbacterium sp.]|nr:DUF3040 domain-containing protein [Microbacterium sp.]
MSRARADSRRRSRVDDMPALAILLIVVGLVFLFLGIFVEAVKFLLWIGIIILIVGVIAALLRFVRRNT